MTVTWEDIKETPNCLISSINYEMGGHASFRLNDVTEDAFDMIAKGIERSKWNDLTDKAVQSKHERYQKTREMCEIGFGKVEGSIDVFRVVKDRPAKYIGLSSRYVSKEHVDKVLKTDRKVAVFADEGMRVAITSNFMV